MNLRQKIKKAKRELKELNSKGSGSSMWDMLQHFEKEQKLQTIINHKRNFNQYYGWEEKPNVNLQKLTHVGVHSEFKEFGVLTSSCGKALDPKKVDVFVNRMIQTKFLNHAKEVAKQKKPANKIGREHIDYYLTLSSDKTKSKKLFMKKLFYQFKGDDKLYHYINKNKGDTGHEKQTQKTPS